MKSQKNQTIIRVLLVLGILILINFISVRIFGRLDLTKTGVYTLSDASKNLVGGLDDRVTIKAYFTEDLPAPYNNNRRAVLDILNDYKAYSKGNLQFEFINPEGEKNEREAQQAGIPPVEVQVVKEDKFELKRAYLGLELMFEDRKEILPVIQNLGSLEYDISAAIKRLTTKVKKQIGYTTGHQEADLAEMKRAHRDLSAQYEVVPVDLGSGASTVPQDIAALLVIAPQMKFSDSSDYQIDQYIMRGGKVAFFLNKMNASLQPSNQYERPSARPVDLGLEAMLENYGIRINADLVLDRQCANITVVQQQGPFQMQSQIPFPYLINAVNMDKSNPVVKDLQSLIFYFASSLDTTLAVNKGVNAEVLVRSSKYSERKTGYIMIDPYSYNRENYNESNIPLAVILSGSFKSYFVGKPMAPQVEKSPDTRIVVVGDGDFMKDDFAGNRGNPTFFSNIIDYLADDAGLITIRSKNVTPPPMEQVSDGTKKWLKYTNLFLPPLLVIGYGLLRWRRRTSLKRTLENQV